MDGPLWELLISFWFVVSYCSISKTAFPLKPLGQMIWNLVRSIYGRSSIELTHFVLIHLQTWLPQAIPVLDWSISKNILIWNCFAKMNRYLVGSTYGRFCIKFPQSRMKGERHWASSLIFLLLIKSLYNWKKLVILMIPKTELFLKYSWICVCQFCQIFGHTNNRQN
jgi:hypothetical protein